jgi:hypothetical protein
MIDDFSKIYLLYMPPNGQRCWDVQQFATLPVKAFPYRPAVSVDPFNPMHNPAGVNVDRLR